MYSPSIDKLITVLKKLPSVGLHTAERFVFHWLKSGKKEVAELQLALKNLTDNVKSCATCWNFTDESPCRICKDQKRDHTTICVVAEPQDIAVIENSGVFNGVYFVLRALLDPTDDESVQKTKIRELFKKIKDQKSVISDQVISDHRSPITEIILALNPDMAGETTMLYLEKEIKKQSASWRTKLKITRLARGLPMGSDIRYADEITLSSAIKNRVSK